MKFSASFSDQGSIEAFSKCVFAIQRMSRKRCAIRMTSTGLCLIASTVTGLSNKDGADFWLGVLFPWQPTFQTHNFSGLSEENPEIVFELEVEQLAQCLSGNHANTKLKLTRREDKPHLRVEIRSHQVNHDIPVTLVPNKKWILYTRPDCTGEKAIVTLPPSKTMQRVTTSMKNIHCKFLTVKVNNTGELHMQTATKNGDVSVFFSELENDPIEAASQNGSQQEWSVKLHVKPMQQFFSLFQFAHGRTKLSVISERCVEFGLIQEDFEVSFILGDTHE